jgi:uncharacterized protein
MKLSSVALALALGVLPAAASAQLAQVSPPLREAPALSVSGSGLVERSPDEATVSVQIITNDDNAAASTGKNSTIYSSLKAKVLGLGLSADAIRTVSFNVAFIPYPPANLPPEQRQPRYGYVTTRSLLLAVTPIENAGKVVDAATAAGATNVGGVTFGLRDRKAAYLAALAAAMNDAKAQAAALAAAGGFSLGRLRYVNAGQYTPPQPLAMSAMARAPLAAPAPPTEIEPNGPIQVSARVSAVYDIR